MILQSGMEKFKFDHLHVYKIVLFKSVEICKRCYKGNFTLKSNSKTEWGCGGQHYLVLYKI